MVWAVPLKPLVDACRYFVCTTGCRCLRQLPTDAPLTPRPLTDCALLRHRRRQAPTLYMPPHRHATTLHITLSLASSPSPMTRSSNAYHATAAFATTNTFEAATASLAWYRAARAPHAPHAPLSRRLPPAFSPTRQGVRSHPPSHSYARATGVLSDGSGQRSCLSAVPVRAFY